MLGGIVQFIHHFTDTKNDDVIVLGVVHLPQIFSVERSCFPDAIAECIDASVYIKPVVKLDAVGSVSSLMWSGRVCEGSRQHVREYGTIGVQCDTGLLW
jgi:hypothetical protein